MAIKIITIGKSKLKSGLAEHTKARKKGLEHQTSLTAISSVASSDLLADLCLQKRSISQLKGLKRRVRKSESAQVERVAQSLRSLKQVMPILIGPDDQIINGHIVAQAIKALGHDEIWCVQADHLDEHACEMAHVALNRIAECGDWQIDDLGTLLIDLDDLGFDLDTTGFSMPELDVLMTPGLQNQTAVEESCDDEVVPPTEPVSVVGDLWQLGRHRLLCGDATDPDSYSKVLAGASAGAVFTDLPYNVPIEGFVSGLGKNKHKNFKMGVGEWTAEEFTAFCIEVHELCAQNMAAGSVLFSCMDWRSVDVIMAAGKAAGLKHVNTAVWNKGSGGMGALYRSAHELVLVLVKGDKPAVNNVQLGKHGRDRTNVWTYPGANRPGSSAAKALAHHPTPKPIELVEDAIKDVTPRKALVLDPFLGSGTTLLAAERSGRLAAAIELDPAYVDVAIKRWEAMTDKAAVHIESGLTFEKLRVLRLEAQAAAETEHQQAA
jgi:DNA modification methylase